MSSSKVLFFLILIIFSSCVKQQENYSKIVPTSESMSSLKIEDKNILENKIITEKDSMPNTPKENKKYTIGVILKDQISRKILNKNVLEISSLIAKENKNIKFIYLYIDEKNKDIEFDKNIDVLFVPFLKLDKNIKSSFVKKYTTFFTKKEECSINNKNSICLDFQDKLKILSLLKFIEFKNRSQSAFLLPANEEGFAISKTLTGSNINNIEIRDIEFYNPDDKDSIENAVKIIRKNFSKKLLVDENDNIIRKNFKESKENKKKNLENFILKNFNLDSIYLNGKENDIETILYFLNQENIFEKDVLFFSDANIDTKKISNNFQMKDFYFIGAENNSREIFENSRIENFGSKSYEFDYSIYDSLAAISIWLEVSSGHSFYDFYKENIFQGVSGLIKFKNDDRLEKIYNIYKLDSDYKFYKYLEIE